MTNELSRLVAVGSIGEEPRPVAVEAEPGERAALARRFGLAAVDRLAAALTLVRHDAGIAASGTIEAQIVQTCVVTGEPVPARIAEPFAILFRRQPEAGCDEEIELGEEDMDVVFHDGAAIDVGEAAAETLALAIDPYPRAAGADAALAEAGVRRDGETAPSAAFAALGDLLGK